MLNSTLGSNSSIGGFNPGVVQNLLLPFISSFPILGLLLGKNQDGSGGSGGVTSSLFLTGILLMISNYSLGYLAGYLSHLFNWVKGKFIYSIVIESNDEIFQWVFEYINKSRVVKRANEVSAHSAWSNNHKKTHCYDTEVNPFKDSQNEIKRPNLYYLPYYGVHYCKIQGYRVFISRTKKEQKMIMDNNNNNQNRGIDIDSEVIQISTFGFFPGKTMNFLKRFIEKCMESYYAKNESKTWLYTPVHGYHDDCYRRMVARIPRTFESVVLKKGLKEKIKNDVELFQKSKKWYSNRGIPYRRGYILYGPPGTGKTSYISALAGKLGMSIAILSLNVSTMDDVKLAKMIDGAPRNSILIIEDVDVAFKKNNKNNRFDTVTLSGLLNALDGIGTAADGRILFMTTNHIEKLSSALLRPGRCDMKIFFGYASGDQIEQLWFNFYGKDKNSQEEEEEDDLKKIIEIGKILRKKIPEDFVSCAELQGFYLLHRFNEEGILDDIDRFLEEIKNDREKMKKEKEEKLKVEKKKQLEEELKMLKVND